MEEMRKESAGAEGVSGADRKKVDEAYKDAVAKEKGAPAPAGPEAPEASFELFISGLMMEGLISLGDLENPINKKRETNLAHAKFVIDTIAMIKDKTRNNLTEDEARAVESLLYELRMRYVAKAGK
jgi:hypothetical protein